MGNKRKRARRDEPDNLKAVNPSQQQQTIASHKRQKRDEYRASLNIRQHQTSSADNAHALAETEAGAGSQQQQEDGNTWQMPKKKFYRQRAHANPFSDHKLVYPVSPELMDWSEHFPAFTALVKDQPTTGNEVGEHREEKRRQLTKSIELADIGCGFGGLLFALSLRKPDMLMLGLEIRVSVTEFVQNKIRALRAQHAAGSAGATTQPQQQLSCKDDNAATAAAADAQKDQKASGPGSYQNISALRANSMKFLPNLLSKHSLLHLFLCFPDPHFKARKHKARIVSPTLNSEYAYALKPGVGRVYTITDVEDLHNWMVAHFANHASFERLPAEELDNGPHESEFVKVMRTETEEGKKVTRNGGNKYVSVWLRKLDPPWPGEE